MADDHVHAPTSVDDLIKLLKAGGSYTLRSAGQALGGQALPPKNAGTQVILFSGLRSGETPALLVSDPEGERASWAGQKRATLTASGWTTWGEIFDELQKQNYMTYNSVTARRISVAGSINASALSQRSPIWGKEEHSIVWIRYYNPKSDEIVKVYHPDSWKYRTPSFNGDTVLQDEAANETLFCAVVGGLGVLGPILAAKFLVLKLPAETGALRVHTRVGRYTDLYRFVQALVKVSTEARDAAAIAGLPETYDPNKFRTFHAVARLGQGTEVGEDLWGTTFRGAIFTQSFKRDTEDERPFLLWDRPRITNTYKTYLAANLDASFMELTADREMANMLYETAYWSNADHQPYTNDLCPATFFLEAHADARDHFERNRVVMECWQQTFSVPVGPSGSRTANAVIAVLLQARKLAKLYNLRSTATDLIFLPASIATLAPNRGMDVIAITFGFEWLSRDGRELRVMNFCRDISTFVAQRGGRVHLGKAVSATQEAIKKMYGTAISEFVAVREGHTSATTLTSDLWEKLAAAPALTVNDLKDEAVSAYTPRADLAPDSGWNPIDSLKPATDGFFVEGLLSIKPLEPCGPWPTTGTSPPPKNEPGKIPSDLQEKVDDC